MASVTENWTGVLVLSHVAFHDSKRLMPELTSATAWQKGRCKCRRYMPRDYAP